MSDTPDVDAGTQEATTMAVNGEDAERAGEIPMAQACFRHAAGLYAHLARTREAMRSVNAVSAVTLSLRGADPDTAARLLAEFWHECPDLSREATRELQVIGRVMRGPSQKDHVEQGHVYWWRALAASRGGMTDASRDLMRMAALHYAVAFLDAARTTPKSHEAFRESASMAASAVIAAHRAGDVKLALSLASKARAALPNMAPIARGEIDDVVRQIGERVTVTT